MIQFDWNNVRMCITDIGGGNLGEDIPRHAHASNSYELHFITSGRGTLITDTAEYSLQQGDFFITGPHIYHSQTADQSVGLEDVFLMLQITECKKANIISSLFLQNKFLFIKNFDTSFPILLLKEYREKRPDYIHAVKGITLKILSDISREILPESFAETIREENLNDRRFVLIEQAFLYNPQLRLSELSDKIGLCERQTQRLLKKYYGKTFREKKKEII